MMEAALSIEGKISTHDCTHLYYTKDMPEKASAIIVIVHGFCEHCGRYEYVKNQFNDLGYGVYRYDHRGHGRSGGERGHIEDYHALITDLDAVVELVREENGDVPIFILGHSMGGFVAAAYGVKHKDKIKGQILTGAATFEPKQVQGIAGKFLQLMNKVAPKHNIKNGLGQYVSRNSEVVNHYESDELNLKESSLSFHVEFLLKGIGWLKEHLNEYHYPCLILHGGEDKIIDKIASKNFFQKIASTDKALKIYENLYHEIFNEDEKDQVIEDIHQWIARRI